jgi:hypothetical protein
LIIRFLTTLFVLLTGLMSTALSAQLSSRYAFVAGHGEVSWRHTYDHNNYVARDWNNDRRHDVLSLTSVYSWNRDHSKVPLVQPHAFLSNSDGSYTHTWVGGAPIHTLTTEWYGDYFSKREIIVGHGNPFVDEVLQPFNCTGLVCVPFGPRAAMHHAITDDIDKDGKLDLITFKAGTSIFSNFQPGEWGHHPGNGMPQNLGVWSGNTGAVTGAFKDLDGDGYPEMITATHWNVTTHQLHGPGGGGAVPNGGVTVWKNHGGKDFTPIQQLPGGPGGRFATRLILKNGSDLILYGECGDDCDQNSWIKVYGAGMGSLHLKQMFNIGSPRGGGAKGHPPRLLDINGDGHNDLFVNHYDNYDGSVGTQHGGIWLNNGNGTFSRLKTPIFARIPKAHLKGMLAPVHANGDGRLDWIVIYQDGTFGTLLASGSGSVSSATSGSGVSAAAFAGYVDAYGDLSAAYSAGAGQNKANWGKSHYCGYGLSEGRSYAGLSAASCLAAISNGTRNAASAGDSGEDVVHERAMRFLPLSNWQLGFVEVEINQLADSLTNNADLLSFNQIQMTDLLGLNPDSAITLGFRADDDESMHDRAYGLRYGDTHLSLMTDSSLLGLHPDGLLHVKSPKTRYLGIRHSKTLGNWTTDGQITYGHAKGRGSYGYVRGVTDIHAMGFNIATRYRLNPDQKVLFSVSQPMRIERGGLVFDGVIGDLVPTGRQTDLTLGFTHQLNQTSTLRTAFTYTTDSNHYQGQRNTQIMLTYSGQF